MIKFLATHHLDWLMEPLEHTTCVWQTFIARSHCLRCITIDYNIAHRMNMQASESKKKLAFALANRLVNKSAAKIAAVIQRELDKIIPISIFILPVPVCAAPSMCVCECNLHTICVLFFLLLRIFLSQAFRFNAFSYIVYLPICTENHVPILRQHNGQIEKPQNERKGMSFSSSPRVFVVRSISWVR